MKTTRRFRIASIILISICVFSLSWAMSSGRKLILDPTAKHPDANGTAVIADDHGGSTSQWRPERYEKHGRCP